MTHNPQSATPDTLDASARERLEAAAFRRLLSHLGARTDVQNIDLMNLAGFCRNCLSRWLTEEAGVQGQNVTLEAAREWVYGMPYGDWKTRYQTPETPAAEAKFTAVAHDAAPMDAPVGPRDGEKTSASSEGHLP